MDMNCCAISLNVLKIFEIRPLCLQKICHCYLSNQTDCKKNLARFHSIEYEIELAQELGGKRNSSIPTELQVPKLPHCYSL